MPLVAMAAPPIVSSFVAMTAVIVSRPIVAGVVVAVTSATALGVISASWPAASAGTRRGALQAGELLRELVHGEPSCGKAGVLHYGATPNN